MYFEKLPFEKSNLLSALDIRVTVTRHKLPVGERQQSLGRLHRNGKVLQENVTE